MLLMTLLFNLLFGTSGLTHLAIVTATLGPMQTARGGAAADAQATVDATYREWLNLVETRENMESGEFDEAAGELVERLFALDGIAERILGGRWSELRRAEQVDFVRSLRSSMLLKASEHIAGGATALSLTNQDETDGTASLTYRLGSGGEEITVRMEQVSDSVWRVTDFDFGASNLEDHYRDYVDDILDDYSFPYLIAQLGNLPFMNLEDFESSTPGQFPVYWTWKDSDNDKRKPYQVVREAGNNYLQATDEGESVIIGRDLKWNIREFPYVSFRLRVHQIPEGADERYDSRIDSGAGIYFIYRKMLGMIPETMKYVWSSTLPVGSAMRRKGVGRPWMVVVGSGTDGLGEWHTYVFNLAQAYRDTFGHRPPRKPIGIGILSDANSMHSHAYADYDDIRALREAPESVTSGVEEILETYQQ